MKITREEIIKKLEFGFKDHPKVYAMWIDYA
jgi:hypothetical protein